MDPKVVNKEAKADQTAMKMDPKEQTNDDPENMTDNPPHETHVQIMEPQGAYTMPMMTLRTLMEFRGPEGMDKVIEMGGVTEICTQLYTDAHIGGLNWMYFIGEIIMLIN